MKVIFLDIDGVLNNASTVALSPEGYTGINNTLLKRLYHIIKETNAKIVLSSTWKKDWDKNPQNRNLDGIYLDKKLRQLGIIIVDKIKDIDDNVSKRGASINAYLEQHLDIDNYIILDDFLFDFESFPNLMQHFIQTDPILGLTVQDIDKAIKLMKLSR